MTENEKEMMNSIFAKIAELDYIKPDEIPNIALYMDQVTTFMEDIHRYGENDDMPYCI